MKIVISSPVLPEVKQAVLKAAGSIWPSINLPANTRRFRIVNFLRLFKHGVIPSGGPGPSRQHDLTDHAHFAADEELEEQGHEMGESVAAELSKQFPSLTFAFVAVECFGGNCEHEGSVWRDGHVLHREKFNDDSSNHRKLLEHVGITLPDNYFVPFERGYFGRG